MNDKPDFLPALAALQSICHRRNIPFVSYRLPQQSIINTLVQYQSWPKEIENFEELNTANGFVISPFSHKTDGKTYLLEPDLAFSNNEVTAATIDLLSRNDSFGLELQIDKTKFETTTKEAFENNVNTAIAAINNAEFRKVVVSKTHLIDKPDDFWAPLFYQKLCNLYPNAYIYFVQMPNAGCWMGATPEPLLVTENNLMRTVSLAGTQAFTGLDLEKYVWTEKELDEQAIVTNFIAKTLTEYGITAFTKSEVENYRAANLVHLKSGFEFEKSAIKNDLSKLITALHPTPSVGGLPRANAVDFILKNEKHKRSYYTGFLGTLNIESGCQLFVNLRCMQLFRDNILLYSGAGITASSVAEKEWIETENKMETLKKHLTLIAPSP